jgi:hypothetical protein
VNALAGADTMIGRDNHWVIALPHDRLREVLRQYNQLIQKQPEEEGKKGGIQGGQHFSGDCESVAKAILKEAR